MNFDLSHWRILWLVYRSPEGITARELCDEVNRRGWSDGKDLHPADLGLEPEDLVCAPTGPANDNAPD